MKIVNFRLESAIVFVGFDYANYYDPRGSLARGVGSNPLLTHWVAGTLKNYPPPEM